MDFALYYKTYKYKATLAAKKQYFEATGNCLRGTIINYWSEFHRLTSEGASVGELVGELSKVLSEIEAAQLLYCLASQENSRLTLDEIEDGVDCSGIIPSSKAHANAEPFPIVVAKVCTDLVMYWDSLHDDVKKK